MLQAIKLNTIAEESLHDTRGPKPVFPDNHSHDPYNDLEFDEEDART